jgi:2-amino-4-hydroxy-6-hydroxymethyldihydropteridine diphosphokinase
MPLAYIGLGSNLQQPLQQIQQALNELAELPDTQLSGVSHFYRSCAIGPEQPDFINAAAQLNTELSPIVLLDELQKIEQAHQRKREMHWGPRTLDLDLLLYDQQQIDLPRLNVPHPLLTQRAFVLLPLLDLDKNLALPNGKKLQDYLAQCQDQKIERLTTETVSRTYP